MLKAVLLLIECDRDCFSTVPDAQKHAQSNKRSENPHSCPEDKRFCGRHIPVTATG